MPPRDPFGWVGSTIANKLRVEAVVAEGGFAVVYRGMHLGFGERVALKCLKLPAQLEGTERDRFLNAFLAEGKLLHRLSRSNSGIVQALDVGAAVSPSGAWTPYLALEWLDGTSLDDDMLDRERRGTAPRSVAEVIQLLDTAAEALAHAHAEGVAHRDIKPANLFIADIGGRRIVKVVDFGIAKVMTDAVTTSEAHAKTGATLPAFSPRYGAPEQFDRGYGATGPWTDVFAFALVIAELVTGRPALDGEDTLQLFVSSTNPGRRPTPRALGTWVTDDVERVMARALEVEPAARYATIGEMWTALKAAASRPLAHAGTELEPLRAAPVPGPALLEARSPLVDTSTPLHVPIVPGARGADTKPSGTKARTRKRAGGIVAMAAVACVAVGAVRLLAIGDDAGRGARSESGTATLTSGRAVVEAPPAAAPPPSERAPAPPVLPRIPPLGAPLATALPPVPRAPAPAAAPVTAPPHAEAAAAASETIRASHILIGYAGATASATTRSREEARTRAEEVVARLAEGAPFEQLAAEYGDDATRSRGGELGAFSRTKFPTAFTSTAFALQPGETSGIVETRYGFHVIRRTQ